MADKMEVHMGMFEGKTAVVMGASTAGAMTSMSLWDSTEN